jgi:hypothetical protein
MMAQILLRTEQITTNREALAYAHEAMNEHGEFREVKFREEGPTLILLPEAHFEPNTVGGNTDLLMDIHLYIDIAATEGMESQVKSYDTPPGGMISAFDAEAELGDKLFTLGVEDDTLLRGTGNLMEIDPEKLIADAKEHLAGIDESNLSVANFFGINPLDPDWNMHSGSQKDDIIIDARNRVWLTNIASEMAFDHVRNPEVAQNGIATLTAGAAHVPGIVKTIEEFGFSRVIIFRTDGYDGKVTSEFAIQYYQEMFGIDLREHGIGDKWYSLSSIKEGIAAARKKFGV